MSADPTQLSPVATAVTGNATVSTTLPPIPAGWPPGYPWPPPPPAGAPAGWQPPGGFTGKFPPGSPVPPGWPAGYAWPPGSGIYPVVTTKAITTSASHSGSGVSGNQIVFQTDSGSANIGMIAGIVIGCLVAVIAVGLVLWTRQRGVKRTVRTRSAGIRKLEAGVMSSAPKSAPMRGDAESGNVTLAGESAPPPDFMVSTMPDNKGK